MTAAAPPHTGDKLGYSTTFPWETRTVDTAAGRLAYFDEGRGETIVFVHGLVGDFTHFEHVAPAFAAQHRVVGVDLPGCGASAKPLTRHTIDSYARAVLGLLDALGVERATLVGHSAGGQVCAHAALHAPARVTRLVLINSAGLRAYAAPVRWAARLFVQPRILPLWLVPSALLILARVFHARNEYTAKFIADAMRRPRHSLLADMCKVFHDLTPDLLTPTVVKNADRLRMPSMIIWGDRDRLVPLPTVRRAAARLPDGRLEIIEGCGHMPIIEQPHATVALLKSFLGLAQAGGDAGAGSSAAVAS